MRIFEQILKSPASFSGLSRLKFTKFGSVHKFTYSIAPCITGQSRNSKRCHSHRGFNIYYIFTSEYIICINILMVVCLLETVHGFYCYSHPITVKTSGVDTVGESHANHWCFTSSV